MRDLTDDATKRAFDLIGAAVALVLLGPLLLLTGLLIRITLGAPILFKQIRPGRNEVPFLILKFRTMREGTDSSGKPLPDADRLTAVGRFLRASSIDELPELLNILKGDMSFVGPRPLLMEYLPLYSREQAKRHRVRPGLTGWAQVCGRNAVSWEDRLRLDVWYVEHRSMALDFKILARTVSLVLRRQGISQPGEATMTKFTGT